MVVETLTGKSFNPAQAAELALRCGARAPSGTDMTVLARETAKQFGLTVSQTDSAAEMLAALRGGAVAVINVGGNRGGYKGVFSDSGHYIVAFAALPDGQLLLADPYLYGGKYNKPHRSAVTVVGDWLYAPVEVVEKDAETRSSRYTLFTA